MMTVRLSERVPVRAHCSGHTGMPHDYPMVGERFMGVLLHPVPLPVMMSRWAVRHCGYKMVMPWPRALDDAHPLHPGDELEVEGRRFTVCGVDERPGCYLHAYLAEA